jgi:ubiquinone/menaquinone biosynthesis C-methylase UbiE
MSVDLFSFFKKNIFKNQIDLNQVIMFPLKEKYTKNFGFQWHKHQKTQLDSFTGIPLSKDRFYKNTKWKITDLKNKNVLELGSGAGRFTEILTKTNCNLFTVDSSNSIFVNFDSNFKKNNKKKVFFIQADIENLPFKSNMFDYVFCYGVIQHTKHPKKVLDILINNTKVGGKISIDFYKKRYLPNCWSTPKYFWRPFSTRININILYKIISWYIPYYLPFDTLLKKNIWKTRFCFDRFYTYSMLELFFFRFR